MKNVLDGAEVELPCEKCGRKTKKTLGWIRANSQFTCLCGTVIKLDKSKFTGEMKKLDSAFADLEKTIKKFNK